MARTARPKILISLNNDENYFGHRAHDFRPPIAARIRVLLIDNNGIERECLRVILDRTAHIAVIGESNPTDAAIEAARNLVPDIAIVGFRRENESIIDVCRRIRDAAPDIHFLIMANTADEWAIVSALQVGAMGFVLKSSSVEDLLHAIETVAKRQLIMQDGFIHQILAHIRSLSSLGEHHAELSAQERQVMALVIEGNINKQIAEALGLSDKTVKNYLNRIYKKLQVSCRAQATSSFLKRMRLTSGMGQPPLQSLSLHNSR
jgi:DNA-binding NarL/FixJ family response regulator